LPRAILNNVTSKKIFASEISTVYQFQSDGLKPERIKIATIVEANFEWL
jgi:hypothetical protein